MATMKRAVGYCEKVDCEDYAKGVFLLNHGETFYCPRCRNVGAVVAERGISNVKDGVTFKEVRVEFNYDPINNRFKEIGIVRDESIWGSGGIYTLLSPLIKTEKRALKVAEAILANLQRYSDILDDGIPRTMETIISFDEDIDAFTAKMKRLGEEWENSSLAQKQQEGPTIHPED
jgi:hypothetical protein